MPLGVLRAGDIAFVPDLSATKRDVITAVGWGAVEKLLLRFGERRWDASCLIVREDAGAAMPVWLDPLRSSAGRCWRC